MSNNIFYCADSIIGSNLRVHVPPIITVRLC
jgi:hypothetical protein